MYKKKKTIKFGGQGKKKKKKKKKERKFEWEKKNERTDSQTGNVRKVKKER